MQGPRSRWPRRRAASRRSIANVIDHPAAQAELTYTKKPADVRGDDCDPAFYLGGHGPMPDLPENPTSIALIEAFGKACL
jgi:hypothetical protein